MQLGGQRIFTSRERIIVTLTLWFGALLGCGCGRGVLGMVVAEKKIFGGRGEVGGLRYSTESSLPQVPGRKGRNDRWHLLLHLDP